MAAMQQAGAGAFQPPGGMGAPAQPPAAPGTEMVPAAPPIAPELETDTPEEVDDELGSGARPRQSGVTVRRREHPLDRAAKTIASEIKGNAPRLATELFPSGPAGAERLSETAFNAYVLRHWEEPEFRQSLLERMAPKGPDGKRLASGVKQFNQMYKDVVAPKQLIKATNSSDQPQAFVPPGQASPEAAPEGMAPGPMTPTGAPPPQVLPLPGQPPVPLPPGPTPAPPPGLPPGAAPAAPPSAMPAPMPPPGLDAGMPPPPGPNVLPPG